MKNRIAELKEQCWYTVQEGTSAFNNYLVTRFDSEKFAELIIRECIQQAHSVGDLRGVNDDMTFGADTAALRISKHFGVEL